MSWFQAMFLEYNPTLYNEDYDWNDKLCEASQDLIGRLTEQFKEYVQSDYKVNEVGNGITMVTSNRAGIALTFADSDLGMYITYMETLAYVGVGPPICFHFSFLLGLPTQAFFIYELIRPLWIQPGYPLVPYSGHKP